MTPTLGGHVPGKIRLRTKDGGPHTWWPPPPGKNGIGGDTEKRRMTPTMGGHNPGLIMDGQGSCSTSVACQIGSN